MKISVSPSIPNGEIKAIASKSVAHRMLICAAFSDTKTLIRCDETNKDIDATVACLVALGADIIRKPPFFEVYPITPDTLKHNAILPCGESGSTLRFLLPIIGALGINARFQMEGRLPDRPLSPLREVLEAHGMSISQSGSNPLFVEGTLCGNDFSIDGNVSSQFISGLLFALSLISNASTLNITKEIESAPYINITTDVLSIFGANIKKVGSAYRIEPKKLISPKMIDVEGDWSNAAFPLALGILGKGSVCIKGVNKDSSQGDRKIIELLKSFGGEIKETDNGYIAKASHLKATDIDASQIPDLVPILATVASLSDGQTKIYGASRLRLKESDRLYTTCEFLNTLGADVSEFDDGLIINGRKSLVGGTVSSHNDHRIAMSAAVCAVSCIEEVVIDHAQAVQKSYPTFWNDMKALGIKVGEID